MARKKRIVIALGGNALGNTLPEQMAAVKITARAESEGSFDACTDDHKRCKTDSKYLQSILEWMRRID